MTHKLIFPTADTERLIACFFTIDCKGGVITLLAGDSLNEGLLAMCYKEEWILPCSDQWTETDATVACQQLGFQPGG